MLDRTDEAKVDDTEELWSPAADDDIEATGTDNGAVNDPGAATGTGGAHTRGETLPTPPATGRPVQRS